MAATVPSLKRLTIRLFPMYNIMSGVKFPHGYNFSYQYSWSVLICNIKTSQFTVYFLIESSRHTGLMVITYSSILSTITNDMLFLAPHSTKSGVFFYITYLSIPLNKIIFYKQYLKVTHISSVHILIYYRRSSYATTVASLTLLLHLSQHNSFDFSTEYWDTIKSFR